MHLSSLLSIFTSITVADGLSSPHTLHLQRRAVSNGTHLISANINLAEKRDSLEQTYLANVLAAGYICLNDTSNATLPQEACAYGSYTYQTTSTFRPIQDVFFGEQLGAGRVSGVLGLDDVTLGSITVKGQHLGVANKSSNFGDGFYCGILGLGFPSMTSGHSGSIITAGNNTFAFNAINYSPLINSMAEQGSIEPYFGIALERTPFNLSSASGGYLTLGGIPPVLHNSNLSSVPVQRLPLPVNETGNQPNAYSYWAINIEGVSFGTSADSHNLITNFTGFPAVIDTGNFWNFIDFTVADQVNSLFEPVGQWNMETNPITYKIDCNAKAPAFGFKIGGQTFFHNGEDLIYSLGDESCMSSLVPFQGVSVNGQTGTIIGDAFLKNAVAVFDFGKNEMRFAARTNTNLSLF
ncbi:acid protease [Glonium stellatum]|uniref:Acid protease n=1 Tax=Glonium stellatum TaxID=574774 RepID=A0A8E2F526_9PEZI|nr:acid protease [Glonium stellatum]